MTLNQNHISSPHPQAPAEPNRSSEAPLQAYVRQLHESRNRHAVNDEPLRGKDPWLGIVM